MFSLQEILQSFNSKMDTFQTFKIMRHQCADTLNRMKAQGAMNQQQQEFDENTTQEL